MNTNRRIVSIVIIPVLVLVLAGCSATPVSTLPADPSQASPALQIEPTGAQSRSTTVVALQTRPLEAASSPAMPSAVSATSTPSPVFYEPAGCWQPPDDYSRVIINGFSINARTYAMLKQAALLYSSEINVAGNAILQGSYDAGSLGCDAAHQGGGAVDISVTLPNSSSVLYTEIEPLIRALRTAGFAAWLREDNDLESGPGLFIHAIAIGDNELSLAAQQQLTGPSGYFHGMDELPVTSDDPGPDRYGGPLICQWMLDAGYADMRTPTPVAAPAVVWQERLRQAAESYQALYPEDAEQVARSLHFLDGQSESAENICGPLSAAILRDAGLLPNQVGPVQELKSYWQARPSTNGRPWSLFPERDYEIFHFDTSLAEFDFTAWPLQPADFVYTYARDRGFEHMFIVTEVDESGRAYTVTNQYQAWGNQIWGSMLILRYLLYDPHNPGEGIICNEWSDPNLGQTGRNGFEVMRKRGLEAGSIFVYSVRPGDTLPDLSTRFGATSDSIIQANPGLNLANLHVGETLEITIPTYPQTATEPGQGGIP